VAGSCDGSKNSCRVDKTRRRRRIIVYFKNNFVLEKRIIYLGKYKCKAIYF